MATAFEIENACNTVYTWFDHVSRNNIYVAGYVIMPNHVHVLLYFAEMPKSLNTITPNAKRLIAYEIIKRGAEKKENKLPDLLHGAVKKREQKKGQIQKVFEDSFDTRQGYRTEVLFQKLLCSHINPVSKKWNLVRDFAAYEHSSASFYERGINRYEKIVPINDALTGKRPGSPITKTGL